MKDLSLVARLEDRITFGAGYVPFLVLPVPVFFPLVFGLIRFQNIRAPYGQLSPLLYIGIAVLGIVFSYLILRKIGKWTFAPSLHRRLSILSSILAYLTLILAMVLIGYLITNPSTSAITRISVPDVIIGFTVSSVYMTILSATVLRQDLAELFGRPRGRMRCIKSWLKAHEEALEADGFGYTHSKSYETFIEKSSSLSEELEGAKTNEGERLRSEFEEWFSYFRQKDSMVRQQAILTGDTDNDNLKEKYQTLTWVREQMADIGGDEAWRNTNH